MPRICKLLLVAGALAIGLLGASGQAFADPCGTVYNTANGTTGFAGTYAGTVTTCLQIGASPNTSGVTDNASVGVGSPSIYEIYFGGGNLTVEENLGNQGTGDDTFVELDYLGTTESNTTVLSKDGSMEIPYESGAGATNTLTADDLAAGYYAIDTYLGPTGTADPQYELNIADPVGTPEPASELLLAIGLLGVCMLSMRRRAFQI